MPPTRRSFWREELLLNFRYTAAGALNALVGVTAIVAFTLLGLGPSVANLAGYIVGLMFSFFISKKFVFRSSGGIGREGLRFISAFITCYLLNLLVLYLCHEKAHLNIYISQTVAVFTYAVSMYFMQRFIVFRWTGNRTK